MQEPTSATSIFSGRFFFASVSPTLSSSIAASGESGPLMRGFSSERFSSITRSKYFSGFARTSGSARRSFATPSARSATASRFVAFRYAFMWESYGKTEVVEPTSAPMLPIVALPVAERVSAPSPKYSIMQFVPPFVVRICATRRITSFGDAQPCSFPVSLIPISFGIFSSHSDPISASTRSAPPTPIASMPRPQAVGVWESVTSIMPPGKS